MCALGGEAFLPPQSVRRKMLYQGTDRIRWRDCLNPLRIVENLWRRRELIWQLTVREIQARYKGAYLGVLWSLAQPLLRLAVYCFVFLVIFEHRLAGASVSRGVRVLEIFCGIVLFQVFAETVSRSPKLLPSNRSFVKNVVFPLEVLSAVSLGTSLLLFMGGLAILLVAILIVQHSLPITALLFPITLIPLIILAMGLSWFLSSLGVFIRDLSHGVRFVVQLTFFMTPIIWSIDMLKSERLRFYIRLNPLAVAVEDARATLIHGRQPHWDYLGIMMLVSIVVMALGHAWFIKTKRGFGDVL